MSRVPLSNLCCTGPTRASQDVGGMLDGWIHTVRYLRPSRPHVRIHFARLNVRVHRSEVVYVYERKQAIAGEPAPSRASVQSPSRKSPPQVYAHVLSKVVSGLRVAGPLLLAHAPIHLRRSSSTLLPTPPLCIHCTGSSPPSCTTQTTTLCPLIPAG